MESPELIALSDSELDDVAGGCPWSRRWGQGGGLRERFANLDFDLDIEINVNIINFAGNVIQAAAGSAVVIDIAQG